jgi:hypothetical protein
MLDATMDDWWSEIDREMLAALEGGPMTPADLGMRLGMSERAIISLLSTLAGQGKIRIRLVELVPNASSSPPPEPPAVGTPKKCQNLRPRAEQWRRET